MIQIKRVKVLSAKVIVAFGPQAKSDWADLRPIRREFYANFRGLWVFYSGKTPLCVVGLRRYTRLGYGGEVVFLLCKEFRSQAKKLIPLFRKALRRIVRLWGGLCVRVAEGFWVGQKFVSFFGFKPVSASIDTAGNKFTLYVLRA